MKDKTLGTTTKKTGKARMGFVLIGFILRNALLGFLRKLAEPFVLAARGAHRSGEVRGRAYKGVVRGLHAVFAVVTLEGPRMLLLSRYRAAMMERKKKVGISAAGGTAIAAVIVASVLAASQLIAVSVNGKIIGYVENEGQYASLVQSAKDKISKEVGTENTEILIQDMNISLDTVIAPQQQTLTPVADGAGAQGGSDGSAAPAGGGSPTVVPAPLAPILNAFAGSSSSDTSLSGAEDGGEALVDSLLDNLKSEGAIKATLYTITIGGREMATLATMKEASDVLKTIADAYTPAAGEYAGKFTDDVAINGVTTEIDSVKVQRPEEAIAYLLAGTTVDRSYAAAKDDTIGNICEGLGITELELHAEYPEYDFEKIKEGDEFSTTLNIPFIHYETEGTETTLDPIPYDTSEEKTSALYLGQRKTTVEGEMGERRVTRAVRRINGEIVASEEVASETTKEPVTEVVQTGTKMVQSGEGAYVGPSDGTGGGGSGVLGRPLDGWYLSRSVGGGHNGADMIAPRGTPIYAATHGTVSFSGVYGGYGNLVIINGSNGIQTYYAHCDTLNVTEGTVVERGQQIATVGTTGRSTAYHLHFEVRVNGAVQEPLDWIG